MLTTAILRDVLMVTSEINLWKQWTICRPAAAVKLQDEHCLTGKVTSRNCGQPVRIWGGGQRWKAVKVIYERPFATPASHYHSTGWLAAQRRTSRLSNTIYWELLPQGSSIQWTLTPMGARWTEVWAVSSKLHCVPVPPHPTFTKPQNVCFFNWFLAC